MDRIEQLEAFLEEDPNDPFNIYALALEYLKSDTKKARILFEQLVSDHPNYLPTYYTFAQLLSDLQDPFAKNIFEQGIALAQRTDNQKIFKELSNAYTNWRFDQT